MRDPLRNLLRADPGVADPLGRHATDAHPGIGDEREADKRADSELDLLGDLQDRLWAERRRAVLLVLQGMDTSGKSGVIKHVGQALNPHGVAVVETLAEMDPQYPRPDFDVEDFKARLAASD